MKFKKFIVLTLVLGLLLGLSANVLAERDRKDEVLEFSKDFVKSTLSDFANESDLNLEVVDNEELKQYIKDKREILNLKEELSQRDLKLISATVTKEEVVELKDNLYDVSLTYDCKFLNGGEESFSVFGYRLVIADDKESLKVKAALGDDLGSTPLIVLLKVSPQEFPLEYQLDGTTRPYEIKEVTKNLIESYKELGYNPLTKVSVYYDDKLIGDENFIKNSRTFIPLKQLVRGLMFDGTLYDSDTDEITIENDSKKLVMNLNSKNMILNGVEKEMDVAPFMENDEVYVPIRFIAESFGLNIKWDGKSFSVFITK